MALENKEGQMICFPNEDLLTQIENDIATYGPDKRVKVLFYMFEGAPVYLSYDLNDTIATEEETAAARQKGCKIIYLALYQVHSHVLKQNSAM